MRRVCVSLHKVRVCVCVDARDRGVTGYATEKRPVRPV